MIKQNKHCTNIDVHRTAWMLRLPSMVWHFLQMFSFIWNGPINAITLFNTLTFLQMFSFISKRNVAGEGSRRGSGSLKQTRYWQRWDRNQGLLTPGEACSPFLCSLSIKSMFSDYFPLNASFTFTLQRALLKHPHSFPQSLSMVALWNLWFRNLLVAPNYSTSWIPRMCAPDNQESFIGSLHYIWCG